MTHCLSSALLRCAALGLLSFGVASAAVAQAAWPTKPVTVVVPFPAGGGTDLVVRSIQPLLQKALGQPLVIENRGGAGGTLGAGVVAKAPADGYTVGIATTSTHAVSVSVYKQLPYDPLKDFEYAGFIGTSPYVLAVHPSVGAKDLKSLVAAVKKDPGRFSFASVGPGTVSHLLGEQFKLKLGATGMVHVPYRGAAPAYTDLIGGQVQMLFDNPVGLMPYIRSGQAVAVGTTAPNALLGGIPGFEQQGMPDFRQVLWYGVVFPKGTPAAIVDRFNAALNQVLSDRAVSADLAAKVINARPAPAAELRASVARDIAYWGQIAKSVGARSD